MRTIRELFRAGFFGALGFVTAFLLIALLIFLVRWGFSFVTSVVSRSPTPEAAVQKFIPDEDSPKFQVLTMRHLSDNETLVVYQIEGQIPSGGMECAVAVHELGGWKFSGFSTDGGCLSMLQRGRK